MIRVWDIKSRSMLRTIKGHKGSVTSIAVMPNGTQIVSASSDRTIKIWDLDSGKLHRSFDGHKGGVSSVVITPSGTEIISASGSTFSSYNSIWVWDVQTGKHKVLHWNDSPILSLALSPDGRWLSAGDKKGRVWIFEWMK
jgi:WD40 repeat protein